MPQTTQPVSGRAGICSFAGEASDGLGLHARDRLRDWWRREGLTIQFLRVGLFCPGLTSDRVIRESWFVILGWRARDKEGVGGLKREEPRERTCPALAPALWPSPWPRPRPRPPTPTPTVATPTHGQGQACPHCGQSLGSWRCLLQER